jgi:hypothetical protein
MILNIRKVLNYCSAKVDSYIEIYITMQQVK